MALEFEPNRSLRKKSVKTSQGKVTVREFTRREEIDFQEVNNSDAMAQIAYLFPHLPGKYKLTSTDKELIISALQEVNKEIPFPQKKGGGKWFTITEMIFTLCKEGIGSFLEIEKNYSNQQIRELIHAHGNFCDKIYKDNKNSSSSPPLKVDPKDRRRKPDPNIKTPEPPDYLKKGVKNNNAK